MISNTRTTLQIETVAHLELKLNWFWGRAATGDLDELVITDDDPNEFLFRTTVSLTFPTIISNFPFHNCRAFLKFQLQLKVYFNIWNRS